MDLTINKQSSKILEADSLELPGSDDYKYYGAAKDLPKVRELFDKDKPQAPIRSYTDLNKKVGYEYFGFNESEDPQLLTEEKELENQLREQEIQKYKEKRVAYRTERKRAKTGEGEGEEHAVDSDDEEDFEHIHDSAAIPLAGANQLDVPVTPDDIKKLILQKKKEALIRKYASEAEDDKETTENKININEI